MEERGVLDASLLGPRFDVLQELAGLLGERLRVVAGQLLEALGEAVGGEPLPEPLEPFAGLSAEEEALGRLVLLRLAGEGFPLRGDDRQLLLGRGEAGLEVGGLLPERVPLARRGLQLAAEPRLLSLEEARVLLETRDLPGRGGLEGGQGAEEDDGGDHGNGRDGEGNEQSCRQGGSSARKERRDWGFYLRARPGRNEKSAVGFIASTPVADGGVAGEASGGRR